MMRKEASTRRVRLFRDDRLERFTLISPMAFVLTWTVMLALAVYASWGAAGIVASICLVLCGLLIWSLFEYAMHRFVFHLRMTSRLGRAFIFLAHGNHHAVPDDRLRNIMPPIVSVVISGSVWILLWLLFGARGSVIFLGFGIGYVTYDSIHYACHQLPMRAPLLRRLRQHHNRHHYAKQDGNYAITAIFWDRVFGTALPAKRRGV